MNFHPDGHVVADWQGCQAGVAGGPTTFELTRAPK
ncbi:hypothetical protein VT85_22815 [Planctomyces sp. SH-PL62]|nr:hypothetical protein VT85_22815 [Planctomyces sp. SH-PL62]